MTVENVLFISIDSLRRDHCSAYAAEPWTLNRSVVTPNLDRFADRAAVFENHYAGSLPCMPARREWLTGTQEFLWRPWGPIEPFDDPLARVLRGEEIPTQLITDHYHYFQHGSHGFYEDFNGFEFVRGHEFDAWRTAPREVAEDDLAQVTMGEGSPDEHQAQPDPDDVGFMNRAQYVRNVVDFDDLDEADFFAPKVFSKTAKWIGENQSWDRWFCYVDSFDVHEPFHCPEPYASMYTDEDPGDPEMIHWPYYGRIDEGQSEMTDRQVDFAQAQFAGKTTMVDRWFGRVLDRLDREDLWDETMVVVTSDHGHYLGDHGWMGKPNAPLYDVLAHTPLFVHHPDGRGDRIEALTSAVDLYATILEAMDAPVPENVHGRSLLPVLAGDTDEHRDWALYGYWGSTVNVTDGQYTYFRPSHGDTAHCYSTEMMNVHRWFQPRDPEFDAEVGELPYTDAPVWRWEAPASTRNGGPRLYDTGADPRQKDNLAGENSAAEDRLCGLMIEALDELAAPDHLYDRLDL
ncbi:MAG: sulfatase-like hydrolase/transferase [Halobacteriales archaeon]